MTEVFLLNVETSDKYGTSGVAGVYSTRDKAEQAARTFTTRRTFTQIATVDQLQPPGGFK